MHRVIAIDGPAGSGKGTVAKIIAKDCNLVYIDTGAMYRAIAYLTIVNNIEITAVNKIVNLAKKSKIEFKGYNTYINNMDVTKEIRTMEVTKIVSPISSIVELRKILVSMQQEMSRDNDVIMEGRDITTVVLPHANYKFYLDASIEERANRRYKENIEKGIDSTYEEIIENIKKRDYNDMHKVIGSLMKTHDAIYIDSTNLSVEDVVNKIENVIGCE